MEHAVNMTEKARILVQDETFKKSKSLAFRVKSDFSTVITPLDHA